MSGYPELYVLRHGQTEWNAEGRHQGHGDSDLTALGRAQAAGQGRILARSVSDTATVQCFASPQGRAWTTAQIALAAIGRTATADPRLREVGFGQWEGLTTDEIDARWPGNRDGLHGFFWHFTSPGGERLEDLCHRAQSFLDDLTGPAVIVTHGILSIVLRGVYLGLDGAGMTELPGGQGMVYHLRNGMHQRLDPPD